MRRRMIDRWVEEAEAKRIQLLFASGEFPAAGISAKPDPRRAARSSESSAGEDAAILVEPASFRKTWMRWCAR
jgi:hypothetical protein